MCVIFVYHTYMLYICTMKTISTISVRFFLNRNVKPLHIPLLGDSEFFPVYVQVTYNRRNTQFKSFHNMTYMSIEDAFASAGEHFIYEEELIKQVVMFEVKTKGVKYELKGLKDRYRNYTINVKSYVEKYLRDILSESLKKSKSKFGPVLNVHYHYEIPVTLYYEASVRLVNNIDTFLPEYFKNEMIYGEEFIKWCNRKRNIPRLITWLNDTLKEEYRFYLKKKGEPENQINLRLNCLNNSIILTYKNEVM